MFLERGADIEMQGMVDRVTNAASGTTFEANQLENTKRKTAPGIHEVQHEQCDGPYKLSCIFF